MKSKKTQYMTSMALFLAIEIILVVTPLGYIPIGPLNATTMHIPVIIAGIVLGKKAGAELGFVFGLTSLIKATIQPGITSFCFSPFALSEVKIIKVLSYRFSAFNFWISLPTCSSK